MMKCKKIYAFLLKSSCNEEKRRLVNSIRCTKCFILKRYQSIKWYKRQCLNSQYTFSCDSIGNLLKVYFFMGFYSKNNSKKVIVHLKGNSEWMTRWAKCESITVISANLNHEWRFRHLKAHWESYNLYFKTCALVL